MNETYLVHFDYILNDNRLIKTEFVSFYVLEKFKKNHFLAEEFILNKYPKANIINIIYW